MISNLRQINLTPYIRSNVDEVDLQSNSCTATQHSNWFRDSVLIFLPWRWSRNACSLSPTLVPEQSRSPRKHRVLFALKMKNEVIEVLSARLLRYSTLQSTVNDLLNRPQCQQWRPPLAPCWPSSSWPAAPRTACTWEGFISLLHFALLKALSFYYDNMTLNRRGKAFIALF